MSNPLITVLEKNLKILDERLKENEANKGKFEKAAREAHDNAQQLMGAIQGYRDSIAEAQRQETLKEKTELKAVPELNEPDAA